jgi:hypothetical protein
MVVLLALVSELLCLSDARSQRGLAAALVAQEFIPQPPGQGCHPATSVSG